MFVFNQHNGKKHTQDEDYTNHQHNQGKQSKVIIILITFFISSLVRTCSEWCFTILYYPIVSYTKLYDKDDKIIRFFMLGRSLV